MDSSKLQKTSKHSFGNIIDITKDEDEANFLVPSKNKYWKFNSLWFDNIDVDVLEE